MAAHDFDPLAARSDLPAAPILPEGATLNAGRPLTSIPGPSVIPERVLAAMHAPMPNIYEGALVEMSERLLAELPQLAFTDGEAFIAIANGHGAWEMALTNTLSRGDRVLVLESGRFAVGWGNQAAMLGCEVEVLAAPARRGVDPAALEERLRADGGHAIKAILVVQIDTASSVVNDIPAIRRAIDAVGHPALLMVDCIASFACMEFRMDAWGVDVTVSGSQKGLMVPPGLGFVWASQKAIAAHREAGLRTAYWDWTARMGGGAHYMRYCGTPPVTHLYGLRAAFEMIAEEGLENIWARHAVMAHAVRSAVAAWSAPGGLEFHIEDPAARSNAVTTVLTGGVDAIRLRALAEQEAGLTLGVGLGDFQDRAFRIGHMGHMNPPQLLGTLGTIEAVLHAMGAPMGGSGVAAAAAALSGALHAGRVTTAGMRGG
ncbi:aminotransferase class V-fold PLP-dependent enzyme [Paralimibaculum aggregatum]|uniref:Aminotransferase class V-fold PLP-dependent enzyme n=1 Tax=Paralimibaculum aggregatum TaxID=3036245 RepID=A0ABQ6LL31_9RHOB|nr:aminotransferase class V-fold PLP-dependent enzyme [Limibaculum sp. NKW23]GMG82970.1 aminotransferase class V-fold PLP-dependent enzyme [Limibaculum sp. NKW23]